METNTMTMTLEQQLALAKAENEALKLAVMKAKQARTPKVSFKVSDKGGVSVYGLGRFPVTLYAEQWARLAEAMPELKAFIEANANALATKDNVTGVLSTAGKRVDMTATA